MSKRRNAREICLQSIYSTDLAGLDAAEVLESVKIKNTSLDEKNFEFFRELFNSTIQNMEKEDSIISSISKNWEIDRMPVVDRCILRMAVCEMMILKSAPAPVVIDEAIELAKKFSTDKSGKFVNGVLDNIAHRNDLL